MPTINKNNEINPLNLTIYSIQRHKKTQPNNRLGFLHFKKIN